METNTRASKRGVQEITPKPKFNAFILLIILNVITILALVLLFFRFSTYFQTINNQLDTLGGSTSSNTVTKNNTQQQNYSSDLPATGENNQPVEQDDSLPTTYTVQEGDNLTIIAEQHNLSLQELMSMNNLSDTNVLIGTILKVR